MSDTISSSGISERREDSPQDNELSSNTAATQGSQTSAPPSSASSTPPVTSEGPDQEGPDQSQEPEDASEEQLLSDRLASTSLNEKPAQDNIAPGTREENAREDVLQDNVPNGNIIQGGESSNTTAIQDSQTSAPPSSTPSKVPDPSPESEEAIEEQSVTERSACVTPDSTAKDEEGGARAAKTLDSCSPLRSERRAVPLSRAQSKDVKSQKKSLADLAVDQKGFMAKFIEEWEKKKKLMPTPDDKPGILYTFNTEYETVKNCWKVGFTESMLRRRTELELQYPGITTVMKEETNYPRLAEKIAHRLLRREEGRTMQRKKVQCAKSTCTTNGHREFYAWRPEVEENLKERFKSMYKDASDNDETVSLLVLMWEEEVKYAMVFAIDEANKEKYHERK